MAHDPGPDAHRALHPDLGSAQPSSYEARLGSPGSHASGPSQASPNTFGRRRTASAFTTPTPAARLLERFGIRAADLQTVPRAETPQQGYARRFSAAAPVHGREATRGPSGSNQGAGASNTRINPVITDLVSDRPGRTLAASPSTPAWRPGGGGGGSTATGGGGGRAARSSYVSRAAAAAAARARATSRQVTGHAYASPGSGSASGSASGSHPDRGGDSSDAVQVAGPRPGLQPQPSHPGTRLTTAASERSGVSSRSPDGVAMGPGGGRSGGAAGQLPSGAPSPPAFRRASAAATVPARRPSSARAADGTAAAGASAAASGAARLTPKALTYTEWLATQTRRPGPAQPQWRRPADRAPAESTPTTQRTLGPSATGSRRTSAIGTPPTSAGGTGGTGGTGGGDSPGDTVGTGSGTGGGSIPRTPLPITPINTKQGRAGLDPSSALSTPTAHSPAANISPPTVARRLLLPSNSGSLFLEPQESASASSSGESGGGAGGGGIGSSYLVGSGFGSRDSSSANLTSVPSITTLAVNGRLRPWRRTPDADGGGGGNDSVSSLSGNGGLRLALANAGIVSVAAAGVSRAGAGTVDAAQAPTEGRGHARGGSGDGPARGGDGAGGAAEEEARNERAGADSAGNQQPATGAPEELTSHDRTYAPAHLYDEQHQQQQYSIRRQHYELDSGETLHGALVQPNSERGEYGVSGTETGSELDADYDFDRASILYDDMVRQASVTGAVQISPAGTLRRLSSAGGGHLSTTGGAGDYISSGGRLTTLVLGAAAQQPTPMLKGRSPQRSASARLRSPSPQPRSAQSQWPSSGVMERPSHLDTDDPVRQREAGAGVRRRGRAPGGGSGPGSGPEEAGWRASRGTRSVALSSGDGAASGTTRVNSGAAGAGGGGGGSGTPRWRSRSPEPWDVRTLSDVRPAEGARGGARSGGLDMDAARGARGDVRAGQEAPGAGRSREDSDSRTAGAAAPRVARPSAAVLPGVDNLPASSGATEGQHSGATHGSVVEPEPPVPRRVRSFRLRMTSEWLSDDGDDDPDNRPTPTIAKPRQGQPRTARSSAGAASTGAGEGDVPRPHPDSTLSPNQSPADTREDAAPTPDPAVPNPVQPAGTGMPPVPHEGLQAGSAGEAVACEAADTQQQESSQQSQQRRAAYRNLTVAVPQLSLLLPPWQQLQHQPVAAALPPLPPLPPLPHQPSPRARLQLPYSSGSFRGSSRTARSISAPRASSSGSGPVDLAPAASRAAAQNSLSSLARELRDAAAGHAAGWGPGWSYGTRASSASQLMLARSSHGTLNSPASAVSEVPGGLRGSISGASNFSALSGPQAGVMYNYPTHGYIERAAELGRWEAMMMYDLDLYSSMQIQGVPSPDEYDDPSYLARSQIGLHPLSASSIRPTFMTPPRPGFAVGKPGPGGGSPSGGADRRHMTPRRTVSASASMLAAAAANASGSTPPGLGARTALAARLLMRTSRSWSPLRFSSSSTAAPGGREALLPGSPRVRITGDSILEALDQILEEESSGRLSATPTDLAADSASPSPVGGSNANTPGGGGSSGGAGGGDGPGSLGSLGSFGSAVGFPPREPSLGAWPSFHRLPSRRHSGSSDSRSNFNIGRTMSSRSGRGSSEDSQQQQQQEKLQSVMQQFQQQEQQQRAAAQGLQAASSAPPPGHGAAAPPLVGPMRCVSPPLPLLQDAPAFDGPPFPFNVVLTPPDGSGSNSGGAVTKAFLNPMAAAEPADAACAWLSSPSSRPGSSPREPASTPPVPGLLHSPAVQPPSQAAPLYGAVSSPAPGRSPRGPNGPVLPPPYVPPTIPEEIFSHPLSGPALLFPSSSTAGLEVSGVGQRQRPQGAREGRRLGLQGPAALESGHNPGSGSESVPVQPGSVPGVYSEPGAASAAALTRGAGGVPATLASSSAATATAPDSPRRDAVPCAATATSTPRAASGVLLPPSGSLGSSSGESSRSQHPASARGSGHSLPAHAAVPAPRQVPSPERLASPDRPASLRSNVSQELAPPPPPQQPLGYPHLQSPAQWPGGLGDVDRTWAGGRNPATTTRGPASEPALQRALISSHDHGAAPYLPPYPPPSLESIQRLLETDLPSPAIAAAVAVLAGSLPQDWVGQRRLPSEYGGIQHQMLNLTVSRLAPTGAAGPTAMGTARAGQSLGPELGADAVPPPFTPAPAEGVGQGSGVAVWPATGQPYTDGHGTAGSFGSAAAAVGSVPEQSGGSAGNLSRSYMALLTLAGERGMPPKPLREDCDVLNAPAVPTGPAPAGQTLGLAACADCGGSTSVDEDTPKRGFSQLVDGPLGRAVRLIAQSMLIVLAGAAGATAAASSANAIFMRPEDLPYEHGTSIYYSRYPRNRRLNKPFHR